MKIAFNPSTVAALTTPPNNKDITFDLRGRNIFARGVKFLGTDTWRDIKINNVSIDSNILDLRNGSNTTLTNTNGVVTINSTWRPVVDNLTSDSTTSSLSAKQGKVLKSLIDGKSNSGHTHDDRYLKLTGGTMASNALITFADSGSWGTNKGPQGARGGLYWTGQSDYAKLYAEETAGDNLDLVIQFGDDNSNGLSIRNASNVQTSYISAGGVITTKTFKGNLDWSYITNKPATATRWPSWAEVTGKPSSFTPSTHTHGLSNPVFFLNMPSISGNAKWKEVFGYPVNYNLLLSVRINNPAPEWCAGNYGSGILYGGGDTKGFMSSAYNEPLIMWAGGNGSSDDSVPKWYIGIKGIHKSIYNLATIASEANDAYNLRHSHANKSVLDGITSALVNNWNTAFTFVNTITGADTDKVINKWDEIVNFLAGITEDNKLNTLLNSKLSVYELANNTNVGAIKNNGIYYSTSDASSGTLTNSPFNTGFALINMTSYDGGDDLRRSRLAFNAYGEIKVSNDRDYANTAETWYNVLTSKNSGISGSTIKLNGTSITVYSSSTADGRYVKKTGDTMSGVLTIDTTNFGALTIKRNDDANGASIQFRGKSSVYGYIGLNNSTKDKQFLRWSSDTSKTYTILDTSSTYTSNGKGVINGTTITLVSNADTTDGVHLELSGQLTYDLYSWLAGWTNDGKKIKAVNKSLFATSGHTHDDRYLKLSGGTMTGNIIFSPNTAIIKSLRSTSNYDSVVRWSVDGETKKYGREIGLHNDGGSDSTGSIAIVPYKTDTAPWSGTVGLFIAKNALLLDGKPIALKSDIPSSLKNPYSLTLLANGTTLATYDGSSAKEVNFTYTNIGAASANHTHTYIVAEDLRAKYPGLILDPQRMKLSFLAASTLGIKDGSYYDVITVRSYANSTGGSDNALLFSKNTNSLYHTRFAFGSTSSWGSPLLIIDSGNIGSQSVAYASKAENADKVDGYHASSLVKFYLSPMTSGASADSAKSWFTNTMPSASGAIVYNVPGAEKTIIVGKSSGSHGHMLQLNYDDNYLRILRYYGGSWKTTDWEKISAGYADSSGNASSATKLTSSAGSASLPIYFSDGKPAACIASSLFSNLSNSGNNISVTIAGLNRTLTVNYASNASSAEYLNNYSIGNPNTEALKDNKVKWFAQINLLSGYAGNNYGFPVSNNANGILYLGTHPGKYGHQLGFSSNGNIYYRYQNGSDFPLTANGGSWSILLTSTNYTSILDKRYYTETEADNRFVNVTGDIMTGLLVTTLGSSHSGIKVGNTYINAINGDLIFQNNSAIRFGSDSWDYNVWAGLKYVHSSKIIYLGLADGSIFAANSAQSSGKLYLPGIANIYTGNGTNLVWHTGNDGSGSGLDADLLDGQHGSRYTRTLGGPNYITIDVGGNANTYYPVVISNVSDFYPMLFVNISRVYNERAPDTWNTSTHKGGLTLTLLWNGSRYWDGNSSGTACYCVYMNETYSTMVGGLGNATGGKVVWLRGGGATYHIHSMNGTNTSVTVYTSTYTDGANQSFAPKTTPEVILVRWPGKAQGADYATSAGNADTIDNYHANGLLTALSNSNNGVSITVGGTTKSISNISVSYAQYLNSVNRMDYGWNGINYFNANLTAGCAAKVNDSPTSTWWHILRFNHADNRGYYTDLAIPFTNNSLYWKTIRGGSLAYSSWVKILDSLNYNEYAPTKTGGGASGTWSISITGNANTVDGQHFNWNNNKNDHTYLWAATDNGNAYLVHRASISVNYANSAGSASSATAVIVHLNTTTDANYPLVWSSLNNTNLATSDQLFKSWSDLYYNPKNKRLTVGGSVVASSFVKSGGTSLQLLRADGGIATFNWSGQSGLPTWLWGGNNLHSYYVYNPSNFRVAYASSAGNADTLDGIDSTKFLRQVVVPNNTENDFNTFSNMTLTGRIDPTTGASLKNAPWSGSGPGGGYGVLTYLFNGSDYGTQMAWGYGSNRIYIRNRYWGGSGVGTVWRTSWNTLAFTTDIPTSLKNPYALTISLNGTSQGSYDGSASKSINITPSSIGAATSGHNHDERYLALSGGTMTGTIRFNNLINTGSAIVLDYKYSAGGFARDIVSMKNSVYEDANLGALSILCYPDSTSNGFLYIYLGTDKYNGPNNLRIYKDKVTFGDNILIDAGNIGSLTVANAYHLRINSANTWSTWYWHGQSGQPTWLWGCNDGGNMYVWNPSNFRVKYATSAGSVSNSLNIFGVSYDGSAAKTVTASTFISLLEEGTSTVTDGTMFITSVVSNSGFADTSAVNVPYKRKAIHLWEYIKVKTDSLYATKSHNHDDRYLKLTGGTLTGDLYINTNLYGPARGNNPRNRYDAALYFFNCNSSTTSTYNFGLYLWDNEFQFTYRTSADNVFKGNAFTIQGSDGQVTFAKTPKVGSALISLNGHTHAYLPLAGGTMNGNARIGHGSGNLYIGNSGNDGWIYTQNIASQSGTDKWAIRVSGAAHFGAINIASKTDNSFNSNVIECNSKICLNYFSSLNVSLCNGGGTVQIGSYTTGDTGNNKLYVNGSEFINGASNVRNHVFADGFRHRSHNSDDAVLLAGGGYSQGVPVRYWAIYYMYIGNSSTDVTYTKRSGNYNFITSEAWESEGSARFDIRFPSGYNKNNTLIFGNGDHRTSSSWKTPVYVTITTSASFGTESQIRVMISDDASLNAGFANIYFMCMG